MNNNKNIFINNLLGIIGHKQSGPLPERVMDEGRSGTGKAARGGYAGPARRWRVEASGGFFS